MALLIRFSFFYVLFVAMSVTDVLFVKLRLAWEVTVHLVAADDVFGGDYRSFLLFFSHMVS